MQVTDIQPFSGLELELIEQEAEIWRGQGLNLSFWWRDDDLIADGENIRRLYATCNRLEIPCLVSVIPHLCDKSISVLVDKSNLVWFSQHGFQHKNNEVVNSPKNEFGNARNTSEVEMEIRFGKEKLEILLCERFLPIFVGPWNRFSNKHSSSLVAAGFHGWSGLTGETCEPNHPSLYNMNADVDVMHWGSVASLHKPSWIVERLLQTMRNERKRIEAELMMDRTNVHMPSTRPIGLLTHHRVMDERAWKLFEVILTKVCSFPGLSWWNPDRRSHEFKCLKSQSR